MQLTFHRNVASDIIRIIEHYEDLGGPNLAKEFHAEVRATFLVARGTTQLPAPETRSAPR